MCGVTSEGETAKCKKVVCDPSYLSNKVTHYLEHSMFLSINFSISLCSVYTYLIYKAQFGSGIILQLVECMLLVMISL